jgi:hypothetical protein
MQSATPRAAHPAGAPPRASPGLTLQEERQPQAVENNKKAKDFA